MRSFAPATAAYFAASRDGMVARLLVWIAARNRTTGAVETAGFWTGEEARSFTIDGGPRLYTGLGPLLDVEPVTARIGLGVRTLRVTVSGVVPEVEQAIRGFDPRLAPVEIHRALFDPLSGALIDAPHRVFRGVVDEAPIRTPPVGEEATIELGLVSAARDLTRGLSLKKSDESQRLRSGDRFRRYADVSGKVAVWWGEREREPQAARTRAPRDRENDR